jgi:hypothetical protein
LIWPTSARAGMAIQSPASATSKARPNRRESDLVIVSLPGIVLLDVKRGELNSARSV